MEGEGEGRERWYKKKAHGKEQTNNQKLVTDRLGSGGARPDGFVEDDWLDWTSNLLVAATRD